MDDSEWMLYGHINPGDLGKPNLTIRHPHTIMKDYTAELTMQQMQLSELNVLSIGKRKLCGNRPSNYAGKI